MAVLRLFSEALPTWTVAEMADALGVPPSTAYRTVRDLLAGGLVEMSAEARYRLGPAFIEFDRLTRLTDPLMMAGRDILRDVVQEAGIPCVGLLTRLYGREVMCIADYASPDAHFSPSYERGRPMPLTQGATSKAILARLPAKRLAKLVGDEDAEALREELAAIRRAGFCLGRGEIDEGLAGLAVPVVCEEEGLVDSLSLVLENHRLAGAREERLRHMLISAANEIANSLLPLTRERDARHIIDAKRNTA
jgi:DNA-binding IclR family transcriptional regulator